MKLVTSPEAVLELRQKLLDDTSKPVGFDTESSGQQLAGLTGKKSRLNVYLSSMTGFSVAFLDGSSYYVPVRHAVGDNASEAEAYKLLCLLFARKGSIYCHNVKHELKVLSMEGFTPYQLWSVRFCCTQVMLWLLQRPAVGIGKSWSAKQVIPPGKTPNTSYGLKALVEYHFGHSMTQFAALVDGKTVDQLEPAAVIDYACEDAIFALRLGVEFYPLLKADEQLCRTFHDVEMPFVHVLRYMEECGFAIDFKLLNELKQELTEKLTGIDAELDFLMPGLNVNSDLQLRAWGFAGGRWPMVDAQGVAIEYELTEKEKLVSMKHSNLELMLPHVDANSEGGVVLRLLLERGEIDKMLSTYTDSLIDKAAQYPDLRLHCDYLHTGTNTGRLSSTYPNLQNIPVRSKLGMRVREAFVASPGCTLFSADYSQIELRVLAHLCNGEGKLAEAYKADKDIHQQTADITGASRTQGKTINFAIVYGAQAKKLSKTIACEVADAERFMEAYADGYPEVFELRDRVVDVVTHRGYVRTLLGRRRYVPELRSNRRGTRSYGGRIAFNTPVQGGARDVMVLGMLGFYRRVMEHELLGVVKIVAQVHDDLVCEAPEDIATEWGNLLAQCMRSSYPLKVPLAAETVYGQKWSQHK